MLNVTTVRNGVLLPVKVVPGASRTAVLGEWNGRVKVAIAAPPEKGKANKALARFLAQLLKVRQRDVTVAAGHASPIKIVRIEGVTRDTVCHALQPWLF